MTLLIIAVFLLCAIELTANVVNHIRSIKQNNSILEQNDRMMEFAKEQVRTQSIIKELEQTLRLRDAEIYYLKESSKSIKEEEK